MNLVVIETVQEYNQTTVDVLDEKISEANKVMSKADYELSLRHAAALQVISKLELEIRALAASSVSLSSDEQSALDEEKTCKQLFREIASLTHTDRGTGNAKLFAEAKRAAKAKNHSKLISLLDEARLNYEEIVKARQAEYEEICNSTRYQMSVDWLSCDEARMSKAETFYLQVVLQTLQMKQAMLEGMKNERK